MPDRSEGGQGNQNAETLLAERTKRIFDSVALKKPDRVPVVLEFAGFAAYATGTVMKDFLSSPVRATRTMMAAYELVGGADAVNYGSFAAQHLSRLFMSKVKMPGQDLPDNEMWQVEETELMKAGDYDLLLEMGWPPFLKKFLAERICLDRAENPKPPKAEPFSAREAWAGMGVPVLSGGDIAPPLELLCGARSLLGFSNDLYKIPDKVEAAMEEMAVHLAGPACQEALKNGYPAVWVGGWRAAPSMLSPRIWDRFAWPYFKRLVQETVDCGLVAVLHLDSNWTRELKRFRELPPGRCILATDGETDLKEAKRILGDVMCLMGDVPASLLYLGQKEEVFDYCRGLIKNLGPEGYILQSGCDIPANAKLENVRAMVRAALSS